MTFDNIDTSDWTVDDHIEWLRHSAKAQALMDRLRLNQTISTMVYYDLPWMVKTYQMPEHLDALGVQQSLLEHGPNPVLVRKAEERERRECGDCGGTKDRHYLSCSWWPHNSMRPVVFAGA